MELEFHQLDLRYEALRVQRPALERRLLNSIAEADQQVPIVVVASSAMPGRYTVIDGYKRIRAMRRLKRDTVQAMLWELDEKGALILDRLMQRGEKESVLEQGWLLQELSTCHGLCQEELAKRFDRSRSWVSRRLALVRELPAVVQEPVRKGELAAYVATKYLVPLARTNQGHCQRLVTAINGRGLSTREVGEIYAAYQRADRTIRERLVDEPLLYLKSKQGILAPTNVTKPTGHQLLDDIDIIGTAARRATRRLRDGAWNTLLPAERTEIARCLHQAAVDVEHLIKYMPKEEVKDVG